MLAWSSVILLHFIFIAHRALGSLFCQIIIRLSSFYMYVIQVLLLHVLLLRCRCWEVPCHACTPLAVERNLFVCRRRSFMSSQTKFDHGRPPQGPQSHTEPSPPPREAKEEHRWGLKDKKEQVQRGGIEPPTSAVLKPRHNQLDHLCLSSRVAVITIYILFTVRICAAISRRHRLYALIVALDIFAT